MKTITKLIALLMLVSLAPNAYAQANAQRVKYVFDSDSKLSIDGTSTIHDWTCEIEKFDGTFTIDPQSTAQNLSISAGKLIVKLDDIECGKGTMNKKLRAALSGNKADNVTFTLESTTSTDKPLDLIGLGLSGSLKIAGVSKSVEMDATARYTQNDSVQLEGFLSLDMTDYGVDPPTAILGTLHTGDKVTVRFLVTAHPDPNL
ncbi:YceI family protein [bacterium]|nr:YceI family protein [bacterium]